jgi:hypothetical protein
MLFQQLNRTDAEKVFGIFQNKQGETVKAGAALCLDLSTDVNGVRVKKPATPELRTFVGMADSDILDDAYGLVQIYGYRAAGMVLLTNSDVTAGHLFAPVNNDYGVYVNTAGQHVVVCEDHTSSAGTKLLKVHIRAM